MVKILLSLSLLIFIIICSFSQPVSGQLPDPSVRDNFINGINLLYNNRFDQGSKLFENEINAAPQEPGGYFYLAMVSWSRLAVGHWGAEDINEFSRRIDKTISIARKKIKNDAADSWTYFYLGGALGFKGRLELSEQNWLASFKLASEAIKSLKTAQSMDPENKDVLLGLGMYDYYTARLSGLLKFLTYVFLHRGNAEEGLRKLHLAAAESTYSKTEAKSVLLYIYLFMENNPSMALPLAMELANQYPWDRRNTYLQGLSCIQLGLDEEYDAIQKKLISNAGDPPGDIPGLYWEREALYLEASRLMIRGYYESAREKLDEILLKPDAENDPAMLAWPIVKKGMSYDLEKNREKALALYNQVMAMPNGSGAQFMAEKFIDSPIVKGDPLIGY
jgi:tetratricopeptide (TPR) repeat protein